MLQMDGLSKCDLQAVPDPTSELPPVDEEEDEDMLAACINIGMQNSNRSVLSGQARIYYFQNTRHCKLPAPHLLAIINLPWYLSTQLHIIKQCTRQHIHTLDSNGKGSMG